MGKVARFGVSLRQETLEALDEYSRRKGFQSRSQALTHMIGDAVVSQTAADDTADVAGALVLIFDHHRPEFMRDFTALQHDFQSVILASQHIHVSHHLCLETITMRGRPSVLNELADRILSLKGVKQGKLVFTSLEG